MIAPHRMLDELSLVHDDPSMQMRLRVALSMVCRAESRKGSRLAGESRSAGSAEPPRRGKPLIASLDREGAGCHRAPNTCRAPAHEIGLASLSRQAYKLNQMVQYPDGRLDASFAALSDATRRGVLERLGRGDASISDLAETFHMTLTGMRKHVGVLEHAELVTTEKVGRVRICRVGPRRLEDETAWIQQQCRLWDARFDVLEQVVAQRRRKERNDGHPKRS
jgi:DNA-binding transcriptional ArsR family regulator